MTALALGGDRLGEERGPLIAGYDDHHVHVHLEIQGRLGVLDAPDDEPFSPSASPVAGELPVGAGEGEQHEGDEP